MTGQPEAVQIVMKHFERVAQVQIIGVLDQFRKRLVFWFHSSRECKVVTRFRQTQRLYWQACET